MDKKTLRREFREARRAMDAGTRQKAEQTIADHLDRFIQPEQIVCAYLTTDGEVDLGPWLEQTTADIGLPRIEDHNMTFHRWRDGEQLVANKFRILEPNSEATMIEPASIDVVLAPMVAFDQQGTRLGFGGGYYDRYLQGHDRISVVGIAFACQQASSPLPKEEWDITLNHVITETGILDF